MDTLPYYDATRVGSIIDDLRQARERASEAFDKALTGFGNPDYDTNDAAAWYIEIAFLKLLAATEALHLQDIKKLVIRDIDTAKSEPEGFAKGAMGPDEPYSAWLSRHLQYVMAIETLVGITQARSVTKDLTDILRATQYPITDTRLFGGVPLSEADVHLRIEGVLRCVFPDLKHKPCL